MQSVLAAPGYHVEMQVRNALRDDRVGGHEVPVATEHFALRKGDFLAQLAQGAENFAWAISQLVVVHDGEDQTVSREERCVVKDHHPGGVSVNDLGSALPGCDLAKDAGHGPIISARREPATGQRPSTSIGLRPSVPNRCEDNLGGVVDESASAGYGRVPGRMADRPAEYDRLRRRVLWSLPSGLYLLGSTGEAGPHVMSTSWFTQVATDPKLVAAGIEEDSLTAANIGRSGHYVVALLAQESRPLVRKFAKRTQTVESTTDGVRIEGVDFGLSGQGDPYPMEAIAFVEAVVSRRVDLGSHVLFVAEVADVALLRDGERALAMGDTRLNYGG